MCCVPGLLGSLPRSADRAFLLFTISNLINTMEATLDNTL